MFKPRLTTLEFFVCYFKWSKKNTQRAGGREKYSERVSEREIGQEKKSTIKQYIWYWSWSGRRRLTIQKCTIKKTWNQKATSALRKWNNNAEKCCRNKTAHISVIMNSWLLLLYVCVLFLSVVRLLCWLSNFPKVWEIPMKQR